MIPKKSRKVTVSAKLENGSINWTTKDGGIGREMAMNNKLQSSST